MADISNCIVFTRNEKCDEEHLVQTRDNVGYGYDTCSNRTSSRVYITICKYGDIYIRTVFLTTVFRKLLGLDHSIVHFLQENPFGDRRSISVYNEHIDSIVEYSGRIFFNNNCVLVAPLNDDVTLRSLIKRSYNRIYMKKWVSPMNSSRNTINMLYLHYNRKEFLLASGCVYLSSGVYDEPIPMSEMDDSKRRTIFMGQLAEFPLNFIRHIIVYLVKDYYVIGKIYNKSIYSCLVSIRYDVLHFLLLYDGRLISDMEGVWVAPITGESCDRALDALKYDIQLRRQLDIRYAPTSPISIEVSDKFFLR